MLFYREPVYKNMSIAVLDLLAQGERSVEDLAAGFSALGLNPEAPPAAKQR